MDDTLDTTGLKCPLPVLKIRRRLQALAPGARLSVVTDDPAAAVDVPHFCAEQGHAIEVEDASAFPRQSWVIRKGG